MSFIGFHNVLHVGRKILRLDPNSCLPLFHHIFSTNTLIWKDRVSLASCVYLLQTLELTVAHRGKTQLNFCSETKQSFEEHNNLFENTTIFFRIQQYFREHNNRFGITTIFSRTQRKFPDTQQSFPKHNKIS